MKIFKFQNGQSLIEVLIGILILGLILSGIIKIVIVSIKNVEFSRNQSIGLNLATTKIEELRAERDSLSWEAFKQKYLVSSLNPLVESNIGLGGAFKRTTFFESDDENKIKISVVVSWQDSSGEHISSLSSCLTKWK